MKTEVMDDRRESKSGKPLWMQKQGQSETEKQLAYAAECIGQARINDALAVMNPVLEGDKENGYLKSRYGWLIVKALFALPADSTTPEQVRELLARYSINCTGEPSKLHSALLTGAIRHHKNMHTFIEFVRFWDVRNLRTEDYVRTPNGDKAYPALAERLIKALAWHVKRIGAISIDDANWMIPVIQDAMERFPDEVLYGYYLARVYLLNGQLQEARAQMLPVLRRKKSQFWVWTMMARCVEQPEAKKSLLCRALLCRTPMQSVTVTAYEQLAYVLTEMKELEAAKAAASRCVEIREKQGWKLKRELQNLIASPWFNQTNALTDWGNYLKAHAVDENEFAGR